MTAMQLIMELRKFDAEAVVYMYDGEVEVFAAGHTWKDVDKIVGHIREDDFHQ